MIISRFALDEIREVAQLRLPCVNVANALEDHSIIPVVGNDDVAIGETVVEYYLGRGFKHFAYVALPEVRYFYPRRDAFVRALALATLRRITAR